MVMSNQCYFPGTFLQNAGRIRLEMTDICRYNCVPKMSACKSRYSGTECRGVTTDAQGAPGAERRWAAMQPTGEARATGKRTAGAARATRPEAPSPGRVKGYSRLGDSG